MKIYILFLVYSTVSSFPIKETTDEKINNAIGAIEKSEHDVDVSSSNTNITENELNGESRAGIIDEINPFNKLPQQQPQTNKNKDDEQNNNPLAAIQNLFSNAPQLFNGSNPFGQLFSSQSGGNFLDNIKIFMVGTQGMVMPASSLVGGFQNLMQTLGTMGSFMQNLPTLVPPSGK